MGERFSVRYNPPPFGRHMVYDGDTPLDNGPACDLLNTQAETIEVLREWILKLERTCGTLTYERSIAECDLSGSAGDGMSIRQSLAKRRIAALEGE